ncbi:unnamed protein product [Miscanthus lutarioriparius]|uniref:Uncharacterized protein n=1 Tax=Miscanthus lutarioriparius TaxID=422564 RepID=A0A811RIX6_9POAL|nr:unnamed protein product [Miscanthus lutarioriparius]
MGPPHAAQDPAPSPSGGSGFGSSRRLLRQLDRRNASKNIGYNAPNYCYFRIDGSGDGGGDLRFLCESLGLSGPDDFAIPLADWEAHKAIRSSTSASSSPSSARPNHDSPQRDSLLCQVGAEEPAQAADADTELPAATGRDGPIEAPERSARLDPPPESTFPDARRAAGEGGIKGVRPPPVLKPPPSMALPAVCGVGSTWDILRSFGPDEKEDAPASRSGRRFGHWDAVEKDDDEDGAVLLMLDDLGLEESSEGFTGIRLAGGFEEMDDEDYSWVRCTRFLQSIVRSSSGREQYGAFIEQFSSGAELRQNGLGTGYKHPRQKGVVGLNLDIP